MTEENSGLTWSSDEITDVIDAIPFNVQDGRVSAGPPDPEGQRAACTKAA